MKHILVLLVLLPCFVSAQDNKPIGDFYLQNNSIIYQRVFKDSLDSMPVMAAKLMSAIATSPGIKNMVQSGWVITGNFDDIYAATFSSSGITGDFVIEIRPGRYRVTILNLKQVELGLLATSGGLRTFYNIYARDYKVEWTSDAHQDLVPIDYGFTKLFFIYPTSGLSVW
jgi:hypothetical protein